MMRSGSPVSSTVLVDRLDELVDGHGIADADDVVKEVGVLAGGRRVAHPQQPRIGQGGRPPARSGG